MNSSDKKRLYAFNFTRQRAEGGGRKPKVFGNNPFAEFLQDNDLSVKKFCQLAEEELAAKYPQLFPPPSFYYLHKIKRGDMENGLNASTIQKLCVLIGCTPNDFITNPLTDSGKWD